MGEARSSVMERNIGPHRHEMTIFDYGDVYAVCDLCGFHDWAHDAPADTDFHALFLAKYPGAHVVGTDEEYQPDDQ